MKVLVACEESQIVTKAFRSLGHEAYSCDVQECSGGHPEWHIHDDVLNHLDGWDLIIAHPPCTYLSNAGARWLYKGGHLDLDRYYKGLSAKEFFMIFYNLPCQKVVIENPVPSSVYCLPKYNQIIQPWMFGHPFQKKTCLWIKGLPNLQPTDICNVRQSSKVPGNWFNHGGKERQKNRSKTFPGIANAMAEQWSFL